MKKHCLPIYMQIFEDLKKNILCHHWTPGEVLPTELELAEQYHVARPTLRKAMGFLEKEGFIIRKKFSGTVVAPESAHQKYLKLDIGFFTRLDLNNPDAYVYMFQEDLQFGHVLRYGVKQNYFVRFFPWQYPPEQRPYYNLDEVLFRKGVDAFIVNSPMYLTEVLDVMRENRVPHVALESNYIRPGVNTVMFDDEISMKEEFELLYQLGHRKIGFIGGVLKKPELNSQGRRFYNLFRKLAQQYGLTIEDNWVQVTGENDWCNLTCDIAGMAREILHDPARRPTAVICAHSSSMADLIAVAQNYKLNVPRDLSVISPLIRSCDVKKWHLSGHYFNMERYCEKVYQEINDWLKNPDYRPACHYVLKDFQRGATVAAVSGVAD